MSTTDAFDLSAADQIVSRVLPDPEDDAKLFDRKKEGERVKCGVYVA